MIQGLVFPRWSEWYPPFGIEDDIKNEQFLKSVQNSDRFSSIANKILTNMGRNPKYSIFDDAILKCGIKLENASTNCKPDINLNLICHSSCN